MSLTTGSGGWPLRGLVWGIALWTLTVSPGYTLSPTIIWNDSHNGQANASDWALDAAVSPADGSLAVVGFEDRSDLAQGRNLLVRKYGATRTLLWSRTWNGRALNYQEVGKAVAIDTGGNIVVAGREDRTDIGESWNWLVLKYSPSGTLLWTATLTNGAGSDDQPYDVAVDPSDNAIVVTGTIHQNDWLVAKLDASGNRLWTTVYSGSSGLFDIAYAAAIAANGDILVTGSEETSTQSYNLLVRRYHSNGLFLSGTGFNGPENLGEDGHAISLDASGNMTVAGRGYSAAGGTDWLVRNYAANGALRWSVSFSGQGTGTDDAWDSAVDASGNIVVSGYATNGAQVDWVVRNYAGADGTLLWSVSSMSPAAGNSEAEAVVITPAGTAVVVGYETRTDLAQGENWVIREYSTAAPPSGPAPERGTVRLVGGLRGYLDARRGESASIIVTPTGSGTIVATIYDRTGRVVRTMSREAGNGSAVFHWDGTDASGGRVPPGVYPIVIRGPGINFKDKLAVLR